MADTTVRVLLQAVTGQYQAEMKRAAGTTQQLDARTAELEHAQKRMSSTLRTVGATAAGMFTGLVADRAPGVVVEGFKTPPTPRSPGAGGRRDPGGVRQRRRRRRSRVAGCGGRRGLSERAYREATASIGAPRA